MLTLSVLKDHMPLFLWTPCNGSAGADAAFIVVWSPFFLLQILRKKNANKNVHIFLKIISMFTGH